MKRKLLLILWIVLILFFIFDIGQVRAYSIDGILDSAVNKDEKTVTTSDDYLGDSRIQDILDSQPSDKEDRNALRDFHVIMLVIIVIFILALVIILFLALTNRIDLRML